MHVENTVDVNSRDVQLSFLNAIINVFNKTFVFSCFPCFQTAAQTSADEKSTQIAFPKRFNPKYFT